MLRIFFCLFCLTCLGSCTVHDNKVYRVNKIEKVGDLNDIDWSKNQTLTDFISPWRDTPPHTNFRALWDDEYFYFRFDVVEPNIMVYSETDQEQEVVRSERVEIFFRQDHDLNPYYCLEMDASGRVFDYEAVTYRQFDPQWSWPAGQLQVEASSTNDGYQVTGKISLRSLKDLGLLKHQKLQAGLFRGRRTGHESGSDANFHWVSWVHPETAEPDFHVKSSFGELVLID